MRITRLYHPQPLCCGEVIQLDSDASNHLVRVLRSKTGTVVVLFNGDGFDFRCRTLDADPKKTSVAVESKIQTDNESNLGITLIQGLSRHDRMEATIQKSVELGVNRVIPVICQRSNSRLPREKQLKKILHWRKVAISACEQSGRSSIPEITEILSLNELVSLLAQQTLRLQLDPQAEITLKDISYEQQEIELFIGPEGGLNKDETVYLEEQEFKSIRFGPRILRTETAGPAAISALQTLWGDF